ncbi:uncharacterized protein [Rutidosis leptorrhynchoides]|uniref:uncharacterized protein n=1 Tax=Rutidosis leptorrhynchoides TaxID=125765 RepID=UPI003A9904D5
MNNCELIYSIKIKCDATNLLHLDKWGLRSVARDHQARILSCQSSSYIGGTPNIALAWATLFFKFNESSTDQMQKNKLLELEAGEVQNQPLIWKSEEQPDSISSSQSMLSLTIGRVMATLLSSRSKKLQQSISRLSPDSKMSSLDSVEESLWFLHKYVRDAADRNEVLDQILVPMIEHSLRSKDSKHHCQVVIVLNWLFLDEILFKALATNLANIISRKDDHYIAFGWCTLVRSLVEYESQADQTLLNGIRENHCALLKILSSSIPQLSHIVCKGSTLQHGFELPSRLSVSAADCLLALTEALAKKSGVSSSRAQSSNSHLASHVIRQKAVDIGNKYSIQTCRSFEISDLEMKDILWDQLAELIILAEKLLAWSRKSRHLHAKGLERLLKWLHEIKGSENVKAGPLLLSSCWKHYSTLLHLDDRSFLQRTKDLLDQYLSGLQYYTDNNEEDNDSAVETRKFFLTCLCLLLGRFHGNKFGSTVSEFGIQISRVLLSQLHCHNEDVIEGVICILKTVIFGPGYLSGSCLPDTTQMDAVVPLLLHFLDERDGAARAVVMLIAEYCLVSPNDHCLKEVINHLASGNLSQRRNAMDVVSEIINISSNSVSVNTHVAWQDIAYCLLDCLGDEEVVIREQASNLLPMIDPSVTLPSLVSLVYSSDEKVQSCATNALIGVLKHNNSKVEVICQLLDSLRNASPSFIVNNSLSRFTSSNLHQTLDLPEATEQVAEGSKLDTGRVFNLILEWSNSVKEWKALIGPLLDKMFSEPSNAILVRFMSLISEHLVEIMDEVLNRVLLLMKKQDEVDECMMTRSESRTSTRDNSVKTEQCLFKRLCPLLVIRVLPLSAFNDLSSSSMYGELYKEGSIRGYRDISDIDNNCVAAILLNRALSKFEFEDVRKLAAELCGRIHPKVLLPIICFQLEDAANSQDTMKSKACLFSICTSLVVRSTDTVTHPLMLEIRKVLETILLWPPSDQDETLKAQHGCIDCLALMICAEVEVLKILKVSSMKKMSITSDTSPASWNSVLSYVITRLINREVQETVPLSFCLCMANVLISACQKIPASGKKTFAQNALPLIIRSAKEVNNPEIRAACIQILFSAVYHLKSAVLPYSSDLFELSLKFLIKDSEKERIAGAKLMASIMASEDEILECVSGKLLEARSVLLRVSSSDSSPNLQQMCQQLLACMT